MGRKGRPIWILLLVVVGFLLRTKMVVGKMAGLALLGKRADL